MNSPIKIDSYCGLCCNDCAYKEQFNCTTCIEMKGCPSWVINTSDCEIVLCVHQKQKTNPEITFCGDCPDFPCNLLQSYSNDSEHGDNPRGARIERCKQLKAKLMEEKKDN